MARKPFIDPRRQPAHWLAHLAANPDVAVFCQAEEAEERGDLRGAIRLFRKSAEMGCVPALARLGRIYDDLLKPARPALAVHWYKQGVRHGSDVAAQNLAMHYKQLGKTRWYRHWLKRAADLGDDDSRAELETLT